MTTEMLLSTLWRATWQGAILIVLVWGVCRLVDKYRPAALPARTRYWLWWFACLQFLVRLAVVGPIELKVLPAPAITAPVAEAKAPTVESGEPDYVVVDHKAAPAPFHAKLEPIQSGSTSSVISPRDPDPAFSTSPTVSAPAEAHKPAVANLLAYWPDALFVLWGMGVCLGLVRLGGLFLRSRKLLKGSVEVNTLRLEAEMRFLLNGQISRVQVMESPSAPCPLLVGWWRPKIVFPSGQISQMSDDELRMALAHELVHYRRRDLWLALVPSLVEVLFFFHPLVRLAGQETAAACEEACDLEALRYSQGSPSAYARFLLKTAQRGSQSEPWSVAIGANFNTRLLQRRITMLTSKSNSSPRPMRNRWLWNALIAGTTLAAIPFAVTAKASPGLVATRVARSTPTALTNTQAGDSASTLPRRADKKAKVQAILLVEELLDEMFRGRNEVTVDEVLDQAYASSQPANKVLALGDLPLIRKLFRQRVDDSAPANSVAYPLKPASTQDAMAALAARDQATQSTVDTLVNGRNEPVLNVKFKHADLYESLIKIFEASNANFVFKAKVQGDLTCSLSGMSLETILTKLLDAAGDKLTWRYNGGTYEIFSKDVDPLAPQVASVKKGKFDPNFRVSSVTTTAADITDFLRVLSNLGRFNYSVSPEVKGTVTIDTRDARLEDVLQNVLSQVHAVYTLQGQIVNIKPQQDAKDGLELKVYSIRYSSALKIAKLLNDTFSGALKASSDDFTNSVIVNGTAKSQNEAKSLIQKLDHQV